jgi:hypothetical protein
MLKNAFALIGLGFVGYHGKRFYDRHRALEAKVAELEAKTQAKV